MKTKIERPAPNKDADPNAVTGEPARSFQASPLEMHPQAPVTVPSLKTRCRLEDESRRAIKPFWVKGEGLIRFAHQRVILMASGLVIAGLVGL
jgi:hypothetical protein